MWRATNRRHALVRLHDRNYDTWDIQGATAASDRFNYDYPLSELQELAEGIRRMAANVDDVDVVFNNNYEDQGQRNALAMMELLGAAASRPQAADDGLLL